MGFTSVQAHVFLKKVKLSELTLNFWKRYIREISQTCDVRGCIPSKFIVNSDEDLKIKTDPEDSININNLFGFAEDLVKGANLWDLFEDGCPEVFEMSQCKLDKTFIEKISKDVKIHFNGIENDPGVVYFVIGAYGKAYPGSIRGGDRYGKIELIQKFNFSLNLKCLKTSAPIRHLRLIANEFEPDSMFFAKSSLVACYEENCT